MRRPHSKQSGFAILIVLVAVAILMLLYFVQIDTFFGPGLPTQPAGIEEHPWVLEDLLAPEGESIKLPKKPKLQLAEAFTITAPVLLDNVDRGQIAITFEPNGRIGALWHGIWVQSDIEYHMEAQASGNIHVKRTFQDENGKDKSRLFFFARGRYAKNASETAAQAGGESGTAWLIGWIRPDRRVQGHITLTTNQQWAAVYTFAAGERAKPGD